jgi:PAS domain S-box-containing protein
MYLTPDLEFQIRLVRWSKYLSSVVLLIALAVLFGWIWNIELLKTPIPNLAVMNPVSALAFVFTSTSLLLITSSDAAFGKEVLSYVLGFTVFLIGTLRILGLPVDQLLFPDKLALYPGSNFQARMATDTAFCFLALGIALLGLKNKPRRNQIPAQVIALMVALTGLLSVIGYIYRVKEFYSVLVYVPMAIHSAVCFVFISFAILFAYPGRGIMKEFTSTFTGSITARLLVPFAIIIPIVLGLLRLYGHWKGIFTVEFGVTVLVTSIIIVFLSIIWYTTIQLNKRDFFKKEMEDGLLESEEKFRLFIDSVKDYAIFMLSKDGKVLSWNEGAAQIKGYTSREIIGKYISIFYTDEEIKLGEPEYNLAMAEKNGRFEKEGWRKKKNGTLFWADVIFTAIYDDKKQLRGFAKITRDITARRKAEEQIALLANLVEQTGDAIIALGLDNSIKSWNRGAEILYGYSEEEVRNKNFRKISGSQLTDEQVENILKEVHQKKRWQGELIYLHKNGTPVCSLVSVSPMQDRKGENTGYVFAARDISDRKKLEEQQRKFSEELEVQVSMKTAELTNVFERVSDGFMAFDKNGQITYVNKKTAHVIQRNPEDIIGKNVWAEFPLTEQTVFQENFQKAISEQTNVHFELFSESLGMWFEDYLYPSPDGTSLFFRDITEKKRSEQALKKTEQDLILSERKYKLLFERNPMPMWILSQSDLQFIDVNGSALKHYGYTKEEFMSMSSDEIRPEEDRKEYMIEAKKNVPGVSPRGIWRHKTKNGTIIHVEIYANDYLYEGRNVRLVLANDVSEKVKAEEDLKYSLDEVRELASHLQNIREEERAGMAREIHDELGQQLTGLKMDMSWISRRLNSREDTEIKERISGTLGLLDETIKTVRRIATELRPGILDDLGLTAAISWQSEEFGKRTGITTRFESDITEFIFSPAVAIGLFRICQESLTNVARHAEAKNVFLSLQKRENQLLLTIADDGKGFDVGRAGNKKTLGLLGMKERTLMMGGKYEIVSKRGGGTTLLVSIPVNHSD